MELNNRTFGIELEFADAAKGDLPEGFYVDKDETIGNSNGKKSKGGGGIGFEVCTPPLVPSRDSFRVIRNYVKGRYEQGGVGLYFDAHVYIGDLSFEEIKKIVEHIYKTGMYVYQAMKVPEQLKEDIYSPLIDAGIMGEVRLSEDIEGLVACFSNSSKKGYLRPVISPSLSLKKYGTLEFRCFNASSDFRCIMENMKFAYRFVESAIREDDFDSYEDFVRLLGVRESKVPEPVEPAIICGQDGFSGKRVNVFSKSLISGMGSDDVLVDGRGKLDLIRPDGVLYVQSARLQSVVWAMNEDPVYHEELAFLNDEEESAVLVLLFAFFISEILCLLARNGEDWCALELTARVRSKEGFYKENREYSESLEKAIREKRVVNGTIGDALEWSDGGVYFISGVKFKPLLSEMYLLKNSSIEVDKIRVTDFRRLMKRYGGRIKFISRFPWFRSYKKIGVSGGIYLYGSGDHCGVNCEVGEKPVGGETIDDGQLSYGDKVTVEACNKRALSYYRDIYIKKVNKSGRDLFKVKYSFVVRVNGKILGFFGIDIDIKGAFIVKTDFIVNHNYWRGAKLVLLAIKTDFVRRVVERGLCEKIDKLTTYVYTDKYVSSKYRGAFKKVGRVGGSLVYETEDIGFYNDFDELKRDFLKRYKK